MNDPLGQEVEAPPTVASEVPATSPPTPTPSLVAPATPSTIPVPPGYEILKYIGPGSGARSYHHTAPISMIYALHQALSAALEEGMPERLRRHAAAANFLIEKMAGLGFEPVVNTPEEFSAQIQSEVARWSRVIREANIRIVD